MSNVNPSDIAKLITEDPDIPAGDEWEDEWEDDEWEDDEEWEDEWEDDELY